MSATRYHSHATTVHRFGRMYHVQVRPRSVSPWRYALVVAGILVSVAFLYACTYTKLFL